MTAKKWTASANSAALLAGNTWVSLALPTIVAELVLLYPFPVAWTSP